MKCATLIICLALACPLAFAGEASKKAALPYKDAPAVVAKLKALGEGSALMLGKYRVMPKNAAKIHHTFKNGPGRRDFGNKMPYAPDRETAMYCGANHGAPHRLSDVWEFHLGSNTWHLICPPGLDGTQLRRWSNKARKANKEIKKGKDVEKNKAWLAGPYTDYCKKWWSGVEFKDGYVQDKVNGGPVRPWHTWDGVTYDEKTKRLYWAVLDSDNVEKDPRKNKGDHRNKARALAKYTGQDPEKLAAAVKTGSSMYMYDPLKKRWTKQMGTGPLPIMRAMGGTLHYLSDIDKTIWYACVGCTPRGYDEGMWSYDANTNSWKELIPGGRLSYLVKKKKTAPGGELQVAYSVKHQTLLAVRKEMTFAYDVKANSWARVADNPGCGWDSMSVFDYDSNADVFILVSKQGGQWSAKPWTLAAYDPKTDKWETVAFKGSALPQDPPKRAWSQHYSGYYDPRHNVFVLYVARSRRTWVYRHKNTVPKKKAEVPGPKSATSSLGSDRSDMSKKSDAPRPKAKPTVRSPQQVCTGWFSAAKNYRKVGMLADARRCLSKIVKTYPETDWARKARIELARL
jgi:hypothetical protein